MVEKSVNSELQFGKEWVMFGQYPGLKTVDLIAFSKTNPIGVEALSGVSLGASFYHDYLKHNGFTTDSDAVRKRRGTFSINTTLVNKQIASMLSDRKPVAVRSSATDEQGGTGIYESSFFIPMGDVKEDLFDLENSEIKAYYSYHSKDAFCYRKAGKENGMGVLIQPMVGNWFDKYFMPVLSGVCTFKNGEPVIRMGIGLGTKFVRLDEAIVPELTDTADTLIKSLEKLKFTDSLNSETGRIEINNYIPEIVRRKAIAQVEKFLIIKEAWKKYLELNKQYYWEFAIDESHDKPCIIQSSLEEAKPTIAELEKPEGTILCEGTETVNTGIKYGKGVIMMGFDYTDQDVETVERFNAENKNFLFIPPDVFTNQLEARKDGHLIGFRHFSNAAAITEIQNSGHADKAGTHFAELCRRKDILFLGVKIGERMLDIWKLLKEPKQIGPNTYFYDLKFKATNTAEKGRVEILD